MVGITTIRRAFSFERPRKRGQDVDVRPRSQHVEIVLPDAGSQSAGPASPPACRSPGGSIEQHDSVDIGDFGVDVVSANGSETSGRRSRTERPSPDRFSAAPPFKQKVRHRKVKQGQTIFKGHPSWNIMMNLKLGINYTVCCLR